MPFERNINQQKIQNKKWWKKELAKRYGVRHKRRKGLESSNF
jgi:hypothetical protein